MTPPALRDYQLAVIDAVRQRISAGARRVAIQAPTGAGKTHISSELIRCAVAKGKRVLWIAHRRQLISQKSERLQEFGVDHEIIMAGMGRRSGQVTLASRDTLLSRAVRNEWIDLPQADVVVVDECHNCLSKEYQRLLAPYQSAVVIGLTATPSRPDGAGLGGYFHALCCTVPTSQLVREGWLVPVRCYAPADDGKRGLCGDVVSHWRKWAQGRATVLFAPKVLASLAAKEQFLAAGIPAAHVDAHTEDDERMRIVDDLKAGRVLVCCNVGVWTEGVDIPCLSCCQYLRGVDSAVLYFQTVGRVMRSFPGKTDAVLIDHAGAVHRHGFPDEDVPWTLDGSDTVQARIERQKKEGKRKEPITCMKCGLMYSGTNVCPSCGHVVKPKPSEARHKDGLLLPVGRDVDACMQRERRIRAWRRFLGIAAHRGLTVRAALAMYRRECGCWPADDFPHVGLPLDSRVRDVLPQFIRNSA